MSVILYVAGCITVFLFLMTAVSMFADWMEGRK